MSEQSLKTRGRPRKDPPSYDPEAIKEYIEKYFNLEQEVKVLQEDKKQLKEEYSDKVNMKQVSAIIRLIKAEMQIECSEETKQEIGDIIKEKIGMVL